jgi:hypothetical protein
VIGGKIMTVNEHKEQLRKLHDEIKANPFRKNYEANIQYGEAYFEKIYEFAETFYHLTEDIQRGRIEVESEYDKMLTKVADAAIFVHDFYAAVNRSENAIIARHIDMVHEEEEMVEACISTVHCYLDTGMIMKYPFKTRSGIKWAKWNEEKRDYAVNFGKA